MRKLQYGGRLIYSQSAGVKAADLDLGRCACKSGSGHKLQLSRSETAQLRGGGASARPARSAKKSARGCGQLDSCRFPFGALERMILVGPSSTSPLPLISALVP